MKSVQLPAKCNQTSVWSTVWYVHGKENNSHFISNEDIISCFLHIDGIRLTDSGTDILAGNFVDYKNNFIFYVENADWKDKVYDEKQDVVSTPFEHENDCCSNRDKAVKDVMGWSK